MQANKGITLIALIVTIVLLIIIASISISVILGENGLISKTHNAKVLYEVGQYIDRIEIARGAVATSPKNLRKSITG